MKMTLGDLVRMAEAFSPDRWTEFQVQISASDDGGMHWTTSDTVRSVFDTATHTLTIEDTSEAW